MTNQLTPLQCPGCGGLLRILDARVWQCAYCQSRYMLLGEADPELAMVRVGKTEPEIVSWDGVGRWKGEAWKEVNALYIGGAFAKARMAVDDFNRTVGKPRRVHVSHLGKSQEEFLKEANVFAGLKQRIQTGWEA